ncbi:nitrous oxide reductase family maturation protein NosD [Methanohalophilus sp. RSK]|uniref:right-handed parallel beta-helix repeat-containing protein n=1 Tax=Methanohalophilus sp. RSK TaxID=2485783 RepID=UPI0021044DF4|nr:right-handed parallel beta-helix repeat-containing protein [Methanohalophilus sp. RSK]
MFRFHHFSDSLITSDNVTVKGFTISGVEGPEKAGIYLDEVNNCTISNNILLNNHNGIGVVLSVGNMIEENSIIASGFDGIFVERSNNNILENNTIQFSEWNGMLFESSASNEIFFNHISFNNRNGIYFISSTNNIIGNNNISSNTQNGLLFEDSINNTVKENLLLNNSKGINEAEYAENHIYRNQVNDKEVSTIPFPGFTIVFLVILVVFIVKKKYRK